MTVSTSVTGQQVWDALENGFSHLEDGAGRFPQVSGLVVTVDKSKPAGSRLVSVMVGDKPLDPAATYKLATNDFMLNGGDGYTALAAGKPIVGADAGKLMANDVLAYIKAHNGIQAKLEGRVVVK